jgi:hypothetical protein
MRSFSGQKTATKLNSPRELVCKQTVPGNGRVPGRKTRRGLPRRPVAQANGILAAKTRFQSRNRAFVIHCSLSIVHYSLSYPSPGKICPPKPGPVKPSQTTKNRFDRKTPDSAPTLTMRSALPIMHSRTRFDTGSVPVTEAFVPVKYRLNTGYGQLRKVTEASRPFSAHQSFDPMMPF